ncbi:MAG: hypothetical protein HKN85_07265 [Gammaproteobacteria bacterium]|nr:hypothetical protein [Gammaproteobacteria bacterium]
MELVDDVQEHECRGRRTRRSNRCAGARVSRAQDAQERPTFRSVSVLLVHGLHPFGISLRLSKNVPDVFVASTGIPGATTRSVLRSGCKNEMRSKDNINAQVVELVDTLS